MQIYNTGSTHYYPIVFFSPNVFVYYKNKAKNSLYSCETCQILHLYCIYHDRFKCLMHTKLYKSRKIYEMCNVMSHVV